jgi:YHS domain-containing protein
MRPPPSTFLPRPLAALLLAAVLLAGCTPMTAQNPSSALRPVNAVADGDDARVLLAGHDVVAYFTKGRHQRGSPQFESVYQGVTLRFASAEHKALFDADPQRYLPQFGGYCTNGIVYGIPWGGDADNWAIIGGKLYIFGGQGSKDAFMLDPQGNLALAEKYWRDEVAGRNSFLQRAYRLVIRVPHYQSGAELAQRVAEEKSRAPAK